MNPPLPPNLATWNVNSLGVRLPQLLAWLPEAGADVVALQETKLTDDKFPHAELEAAGWRAEVHGQRTYNGVALLSRIDQRALHDVTRGLDGFEDEQARVLRATCGQGEERVRVIGAYFPNGQAPGTDKFAYKMRWLEALRETVRSELAAHPRLALLGDYNIAPDDRDVHDPVLWAGQILCTDEERGHFHALCGLGLHDSFRLFEQPPKLWTWWDYRQLAFRRNQGLRIDHILVSDALKASVTEVRIDKAIRKNERASDHAPVVATLRPPG